MDNNELYPELVEYIFTYCGKYFWQKEITARVYFAELAKAESANAAMYKVILQNKSLALEPEVAELVKDGFEIYKMRIAKRIFNEYKSELDLNLCPKCGKIARTPQAKQCRFCLHDWH